MGYRRKPTIFHLIFEEYPGLEVNVRSVSIEELNKVLELAHHMTSSPDDRQVNELFGWFAKRLVSWTLEDEDGKPVPVTLKGVLGEELDFILTIVQAWVRAITGRGRPLPNASSDGESPDPLEASIPVTPAESPGS